MFYLQDNTEHDVEEDNNNHNKEGQIEYQTGEIGGMTCKSGVQYISNTSSRTNTIYM